MTTQRPGMVGVFVLGMATSTASISWATDCGDVELVETLALMDSVGEGAPRTLVDSATRLRLVQNRQWEKGHYLLCIDLQEPSENWECASIEPDGEE
jgi:hypothetical protein